jgi:urease accessory protein
LNDASTLLTALQFGDGQFPGGGFAFSWGLESLIADAKVSRATFGSFLASQMQHRWVSSDRIIVGHAHAAADDLPRLLALDDLTDVWATVEAIRQGSKRAGGALLGTHLRLGIASARPLRDAISRGEAQGHLAVVQGVVLAGVGLDATSALAVSAYGMAQSLCTAAIRLGLISHLDAQRALSALSPLLGTLIAEPLPGLDAVSSFTPLADIAAMRHPDQAQRLFSN